jgi:HAD superfamily phosphatase (TIGR01668 family)
MRHLVTPHYRVETVLELTPARLQGWFLRTLLLDVDCTLTRYRREIPSPELLAWIASLRAEQIGLCLVSNGLSDRIRRFAAALGLPYVARAMKPFPWGIRSAIRTIGAAPTQTAMVGDQLFADIMAGRLAGIRTILVEPIHPEEEPWFTRLKRLPERKILASLEITPG